MSVQKLPKSKLIAFALGQFGWSLGSFAVANAITYFYMPPKQGGAEALFPTFIFQGLMMGLFTLIGFINFGGRVLDAVTDPILANMSDRSTSKFGRRRLFLAISAVPTALFAFLVFVPISASPTINSIWLIVCIVLFYIFITMYCTPYNALISELGHNPDERLTISTAISITWALGFAIGNQVYVLRPIFMDAYGMSSAAAFQTAIGVFSLIAAVFMLMPVIFIDEKKYAESHVSSEGVIESLVSTFKNRNFKFFMVSDLMYWIALNFIQQGVNYYIINLLNLDPALPSALMMGMFVLSFVFYVPISLIAKRFGKKKILVFAFAIFAFNFALVLLMGKMPMPAAAQAWLVILLAALPIAIFGILPNAIIADIAEADGIASGNFKAGIFFGARTFTMKLGISIANLIFPTFVAYGNAGIRMTGLAALIFCTLGLLFFLKYDEVGILKTLAKKEKLTPEELAEIQNR
jgi:Na+/melibiose symporter-like transporter